MHSEACRLFWMAGCVRMRKSCWDVSCVLFFPLFVPKVLRFTSGLESGLYLAVHLNACSHVMACSSVCDWQLVGWLERALLPAVCSQLHMLGATGEESVDFSLVVTFPRRDWRIEQAAHIQAAHIHGHRQGCCGACNVNSVLCLGRA